MSCVTVLLIEPEGSLRAHFEHILMPEPDLLPIIRPDFPFTDRNFQGTSLCDVLLLDADRTPVLDVRLWAKIRVLLPAVHIIALTTGEDNRILEAVLAAGLTGLFHPDCERAVLVTGIHQAAQGVLCGDRSLIEQARAVVLGPPLESQIRFGGLAIDLQQQQVTRWGRPLHLTPLEFAVLAHLAHQRGHTVSLSELLATVWLSPPANGGTLAQVHNCIKRIRQKIEPDVRHPRYLLSERGWGYWLQDPAAPQPTLQLDAANSSQAVLSETNLIPD